MMSYYIRQLQTVGYHCHPERSRRVLRLSLIVVALIWLSPYIKAQDPVFSQAYFAPVYMNPALTGSANQLRIGQNNMLQWTNVPGPINTYGLFADTRCTNVGLGFNALHDSRGEGFLNTTGAGFSFSYTIFTGGQNSFSTRFPKALRDVDLSFGIAANYVTKTIDWDRLEFTSQFDPVQGKIIPNNSMQRADGANYRDFNTGLVFKKGGYYNGKPMLFNMGGSISHLTRPAEGFYTDVRLPMRFTLHTGLIAGFGRDWRKHGTYYYPYFVYYSQGEKASTYTKQREWNAGMYVLAKGLTTGAFYRNALLPFSGKSSNQAGLVAGYNMPLKQLGYSLQATYSYCTPLTGVSPSSFGTHEITLTYLMGRGLFCKGTPSQKGASKCLDQNSAFRSALDIIR
jgi:type IX secretion system PorP/SprF family membrane protein